MKRSNLFTFGFALAVCLFCSVALALAATALKPAQQVSQRLDVIQNIFAVAGYSPDRIQELSKNPQEVLDTFHQEFGALIVDRNNEEVALDSLKEELVTKLNYNRADLDEREAFEIVDIYLSKLHLLTNDPAELALNEESPKYKLLFLYKPAEDVEAYIMPVEGNGLWGLIKGYIALSPDLNTVSNIRFYDHIETPGLGGEISKDWFTDQFKGKKILDESGEFVSITVVKGKADEKYEGEALTHYVDGISGGTITGQGVTKFLQEDLGAYNEYFATIRSQDETAAQEQPL